MLFLPAKYVTKSLVRSLGRGEVTPCSTRSCKFAHSPLMTLARRVRMFPFAFGRRAVCHCERERSRRLQRKQKTERENTWLSASVKSVFCTSFHSDVDLNFASSFMSKSNHIRSVAENGHLFALCERTKAPAAVTVQEIGVYCLKC